MTSVGLADQQLLSAATRLAPPTTVTSLPNIYSPLKELLSIHLLDMRPGGGAITAPRWPALLTASSRPCWPALALAEPPLGKYSVLAAEGGVVQLYHGPEASPLLQEVFSAVLNASHMLPFRGQAHDGRELLYLTKEEAAVSSADIHQLRRLGGRINLTVHDTGEGGSKSSAVDVRLHLEFVVANIRYGTTPQKEAARHLRHGLRSLAPRVWEREAASARWTAKERRQLETSGSVPGYELEYRHSPLTYPELFNDPTNIQVVKIGKRSTHDRHRDQQ
jgi:GHH signature containing HNH/Endo VII superfamily nuclease toxin